MSKTVTIEIPAASEALVRQLLALHEELQALALSAADGTVLDACEAAVVPKGRELTKNILAQAVARRVEAAEKGGVDPQLLLRAGQREPRDQIPPVRNQCRCVEPDATVLAVPLRSRRGLRRRCGAGPEPTH